VNLYVASLFISEVPTLWSEGEGRRRWAEITKTVHWISRGSRDGM